MPLRPYQQQAHDAAIDWCKKSTDPCLIEAPTGSGKSHIVAAIADTLHKVSQGKRILCLAPSAELTVQNRDKYLATGNKASMFSSSAGDVCMRHPVIFGTPLTVKNKIRRFSKDFCAVVLDEAHGITPTVRKIIESIKEHNKNLRVIGLSATPYRLNTGYIYAMDEEGKPNADHECKDPYFTARVFTISAHYLIEQGYLTPPHIGHINADSYDTQNMAVNSRGQFDKADVDRAYHGHGRKTSRIVADIVAKSRNKNGVMIFAATVQHAEEVMASLPPGLSAIVTGKTKKADRDRIINRFKAREIKYLVNVSVLTTGFDAPHVDAIALLRKTESVGLLQQIIGRGLRIDDGKEYCEIWDYAHNLEQHCPDGDIFSPEIKAAYSSGESFTIQAECALCGTVNEFKGRPNPDGFEVDQWGYFLDLNKERIKTESGEMPAHYGRRCLGMKKVGATYEQCEGRWSFKECPHCGEENDIAARYCHSCKGEMIDPNDKLREEFAAFKRDPRRLQTDEVLSFESLPCVSRSGKETIRVNVTTPYRSFSYWLMPQATSGRWYADYQQYLKATENGAPDTITYRKEDSGFYRVHDYGREVDAV